MNRAYIPENTYTAAYTEKTSRSVSSNTVEGILTFFDLVIGFFASAAIRKTLRVIGAALCFFAFLFVIGAVEAATISFGAGILSTLLLCAMAFLCVYRSGERKNDTK